MSPSPVRLCGAPVPLGSNAFLGAAAARLRSDSPASLVSHAFLARFHYRRAAERGSARDTRESEQRPLLRLRYAIRRRGTGLLLRRTGERYLALAFFVFFDRAEIGSLGLQAVALDLAIER